MVTEDYTDVIEAYLLEMERRRSKEQEEGSFTVSQLYHVLADMFGAGTDTALTTIKWIVLYLILHPDVQVSTSKSSLTRFRQLLYFPEAETGRMIC